MSEDDKMLLQALKSFKYTKNDVIPNERENMIICIVLLARQYKKHSDVMRILEENSDKDFSMVSQIIIKSDMFPHIEIVDEE